MRIWIGRAILFLVLGALINVAVAFGFALRMPLADPSNNQAYVQLRESLIILALQRPGELRLTGRRVGGYDFSIMDYPNDRVALEKIVPAQSPFADPMAVAHQLNTGDTLLNRNTLIEHWHGWPMLSMRGRASVMNNPDSAWLDVTTSGAVEITLPFQLAGSDRRLLVYHPVWPGFALNTIFYALLILAGFMLLTFVQRSYRRARNRCIYCSYDLRGADHATCPECGCASPHHRRTMYDIGRQAPLLAARN